jgi:hypothetical protein
MNIQTNANDAYFKSTLKPNLNSNSNSNSKTYFKTYINSHSSIKREKIKKSNSNSNDNMYSNDNTNNNNNNNKLSSEEIYKLVNKKKKWQNIESQISTIINELQYLMKCKKYYSEHIDDDKYSSDKEELNKIKLKFYNELLSFYKNKLKNICNLLEDNCNHIIITDSIDISPDESQTITYCELCESTF